MKYIVLVPDGMADYPVEELSGLTPLEASRVPNMNRIAREGKVGMCRTIPEGMTPASDVANISILGYDPEKYYTGRGPLEAANMGVELTDGDVAFRCNLITASEDKLVDYSAGHVPNKEAEIIINAVNDKLKTDRISFYPGVSYRHLMVVKNGIDYQGNDLTKINCHPPHNIIGESISKHLPKGQGSKVLIDLMNSSREFLAGHEINKVRIDLGENPANMIWLWGQGRKPDFQTFREKYGLTGSIISAVNLINGLGIILGLNVIKVPGATGYYDTNYQGKAEYAMRSLEDNDFVFVHVEATDEAGHNGDILAKKTAIENFDKFVVGTVLKHIEGKSDCRILVMPDHVTPVELRKHTSEPVLFAMWGQGVIPDEIQTFGETAAKDSKLVFERGHELMDFFVKS